MHKNKKGLSGIVTTLIIIGIALAVVGIVWYVINGVLEGQRTEVEGASEKVFQDCVPAGYVAYDEDTQTCNGTVKYVGGNMCCDGSVS